MNIDINIDKHSRTPIYRQIVDQVTQKIDCGVLRGGDQLPAARLFCKQYNISRGTVERAYSELVKKLKIESIQGSGTFIKGPALSLRKSKRETALTLIDDYLNHLESKEYTINEIESCVGELIKLKRKEQYNIKLTIVEICVETLDSALKQIKKLPGVAVRGLLFSDIEKDPYQLLDDVDYIITSAIHVTKLFKIAPTIKEKVIRICFNTSLATLNSLAEVGQDASVAVLGYSTMFARTVLDYTKELNLEFKTCGCGYIEEGLKIKSLLDKSNVLITMPNYSHHCSGEQKQIINDFLKRGGSILMFDYAVDEGSIIYIQEQVERSRVISSPGDVI